MRIQLSCILLLLVGASVTNDATATGADGLLLLTPSTGERTCVPFPNFTWIAHPLAFAKASEPVKYDIQIARDSAFEKCVDTDTIHLNRYVPDRALPEGTIYWRVRAIPYNQQPETWSATGTFAIAACEEKVTLAYDANSDNHQPIVQAAIDRAIAMNKQGKSVEIVFPKGLYLGRKPAEVFMRIDGATNLIINGNGATIHLMQHDLSFSQITKSRNVLVRDFTVDIPKEMVFTQGRVLAVDQAKGEIEVQLEPGFPTYDDPWMKKDALFALLDPKIDGRLKSGAPNFYRFPAEGIRKLGERRYILTLAQPSYGVEVGKVVVAMDPRTQAKYFKVGDRFVHSVATPKSALCFITDSEKLTLCNITSYGSVRHYVAFYSSFISVLHCRTILREGCWWEGTADGVHFRGHKVGPWIEDCEFNGIGDDGVALYSRPMTIRAVHPGGSKSSLMVKPDHFCLQPGDEVALFNPHQGQILAEPKVKTVNKSGSDWLVEFDREIPGSLKIDGTLTDVDQLWNRSKSCGDFMIRNSRFYGVRRFGNVFRAKNGVIEGNVYRGVSAAAVMFLNETQYPNGLYCSNIIVRNNTIRNCAFDSCPVGAISIHFKRRDGKPADSYGPNSILIENNKISDCPRNALDLWSARDVVLRGNTVNGKPLETNDAKQVRLQHVQNIQWLPDTTP